MKHYVPILAFFLTSTTLYANDIETNPQTIGQYFNEQWNALKKWYDYKSNDPRALRKPRLGDYIDDINKIHSKKENIAIKNEKPKNEITEPALTLTEYKTIVKGWHLNNHCQIITGNKARNIKVTIYNIDRHLNKIHDPKVVTDIKENAKSIIKDPKYKECGTASKTLIHKTPHRGDRVLRNMYFLKYGLNTPEKKKLFRKYSIATTGIELDYQCDLFPRDKSEQVHQTYADITQAIIKIIPKAKKRSEKPSVTYMNCTLNERKQRQIERSLKNMELLKKELKL